MGMISMAQWHMQRATGRLSGIRAGRVSVVRHLPPKIGLKRGHWRTKAHQANTLSSDVIPPLLLTIDEAARALRVSKRVLWQLTKDGSIKCKKVGKLVRYRKRDIEAWSES